MKIKFLVLATVCLFSFCATAQTKPVVLPLDIKQINTEAKALINEFGYYLTRLAMSKEDVLHKNNYINYLLSIFEQGSTVEVVNAKKKEDKHPYPIEAYLRKVVANYTKKFDIVFVAFKLNYVDTKHLVPISNDKGEVIKYKGTYQYTQGFCAKKEAPFNPETFKPADPNSYDYCDSTVKEGDFFLEKQYTRVIGNHWTILLGDITAKHVYNLKQDD